MTSAIKLARSVSGIRIQVPEDFHQALVDTRRILKGRVEEVNTVKQLNETAYRKLLGSALPHVIHSEEENNSYIAKLQTLHNRRILSPEEETLAELLTLLIEDFEDGNYVFSPPTPVEALRELMDSNHLKQTDLLDVFGSPSVISEVLSGKRELSKKHISLLSVRFHVSPELFFAAPTSQQQ